MLTETKVFKSELREIKDSIIKKCLENDNFIEVLNRCNEDDTLRLEIRQGNIIDLYYKSKVILQFTYKNKNIEVVKNRKTEQFNLIFDETQTVLQNIVTFKQQIDEYFTDGSAKREEERIQQVIANNYDKISENNRTVVLDMEFSIAGYSNVYKCELGKPVTNLSVYGKKDLIVIETISNEHTALIVELKPDMKNVDDPFKKDSRTFYYHAVKSTRLINTPEGRNLLIENIKAISLSKKNLGIRNGNNDIFETIHKMEYVMAITNVDFENDDFTKLYNNLIEIKKINDEVPVKITIVTSSDDKIDFKTRITLQEAIVKFRPNEY